MTRKMLRPNSIRAPFARYAHGVEVPVGHRLLVTSGQLGIAPDETIPTDTRAQAELCFAALDAILAEGGMSRADVIRINGFVTSRSEMPAYMAARDEWLSERADDDLPASTLVIVSGFTRAEFKVEIEVTAAAM